MTITVLELYPQHLRVNGDMGNNIVLEKRMSLAGVDVRRLEHDPGAQLPERPDIVTIGSGPDSAVRAIAGDVAAIASTLRAWADDGVPLLAVTAGFHVLGRSIRFSAGDTVTGAGVFDVEVSPRPERALTHSFVVDTAYSADPSVEGVGERLVGVENHGVVIGGDAPAFGRVVNGVGNDGRGAEGAVAANAIGTQIHGPVLAMNPALADRLIRIATDRAGVTYEHTADHERIDAIARQTRDHLARAIGVTADRRRA